MKWSLQKVAAYSATALVLLYVLGSFHLFYESGRREGYARRTSQVPSRKLAMFYGQVYPIPLIRILAKIPIYSWIRRVGYAHEFTEKDAEAERIRQGLNTPERISN